MSAHAQALLRRSFADLIDDPRLTEICVNADGTVWIERAGDPAMIRSDLHLAPEALRHLGHDLAGDRALSEASPLAGTEFEIEGGLWRSQVIAPPVIAGPSALALRRSVAEAHPLEALLASAELATEAFDCSDAQDAAVFAAHDARDLRGFLKAAIAARWNLVFSGGTSSGKTSWARACLALIAQDERILTIEDSFELRTPHPNALALRTAPQAPSGALLRAALRLRPDRIVMGELRGAEAWDYLSAINSGHPGAITTLHASSPEAALSRLAFMVLEGGHAMGYADVHAYCRTMIDAVIQLRKDGTRRRVSAIQIFRERQRTDPAARAAAPA